MTSQHAQSLQRMAAAVAALGFTANLVRLKPDLGFPIFAGCILLAIVLLFASVVVSAVAHKRQADRRRGEALAEGKGRIIIQDR